MFQLKFKYEYLVPKKNDLFSNLVYTPNKIYYCMGNENFNFKK